MVRICSGRARPRRIISTATPVPTARKASVIRDIVRSIWIYVARVTGAWNSWNGNPCIV